MIQTSAHVASVSGTFVEFLVIMPTLCAVFGCGNNSKRDKEKGFFRIPKVIKNNDPEKRDEILSKERRELWLRNISRADLDDKKAVHTRVCGDHFVSGKTFMLLYFLRILLIVFCSLA